MAYDGNKLNNIAGSTGATNMWLYTDNYYTIATLQGNNWFAGGNTYNIREGDIILLKGHDGVAFGYFTAITATTSTLAPLTDVT